MSGDSREGRPAIRIVLDITRLVEEGKLTTQEAERLQALARRDTGSLAINVLMSFGPTAYQRRWALDSAGERTRSEYEAH